MSPTETTSSMASPEPAASGPTRTSWIPRNWLSVLGLLVIFASAFSFALLFIFDLISHNANPYIGVVAYLVAPMFTTIGLAMLGGGILLARRAGQAPPVLTVDLARGKDQWKAITLLVLLVGILVLSAFGTYKSYHFTESVSFCGQACHEVMKPEFTAYLRSPHARVTCTDCHIGAGAEWYVKAKINGLRQVIATARNTFHRPIETPIKNLRPAQDTCEQCHWPQKFVGDVVHTYRHYLSDDDNTPYSLRLVLKVGGSDAHQGPVGGIHWHVNKANKVEYIATDPQRQVIPWVRVTNEKGEVTEYRTSSFKGDPSKYEIRRMDCLDCHNRPSHLFLSPGEALDDSLHAGRLDPKMPAIKGEGLELLSKTYATDAEAAEKIATRLQKKYATDPRVKAAIEEIQRIYRENFFPEMKSNWQVYPVNIGHKNWPGCFRCHDDDHKSASGGKTIPANDCNACHIIVAQGKSVGPNDFMPGPIKFKHPGGSMEDQKCNECHNDTSDNTEKK